MKRSTCGLAVLVLGVGFGAAIALGGPAVTAALAVALLAFVGAAAFGIRAPSPPESAPDGVVVALPNAHLMTRPTDDPLLRGLWTATSLTLLIVAADTQAYTLVGSAAFRYGLLVIPGFALLGAATASKRARLDRMTAADRFLLVLVVCGLLGALVGRIFRHTPESGLIIFLPMVLGLTHLLARERASAADAERYQRVIMRIGLVYLVLGVLAQTPVWPLGTPRVEAHPRSYFVALGVAAVLLSGNKAFLGLMLALTAVMFLQYAAATWLIVAMCASATLYATSPRGRRSAGLVMFAFAIGVLGFGLTQVQGGQSSVAKGYFASVDKGNNTNTRSQLWKAAELEIKKSPFVGSLFTGNFTVPNVGQVISILPENATIEPHNDALEMLVLGGVVGLFLLGAFIVSTNVIVIRRIHRLSDEGAVSQRNLARALLVGFNAAFAASLFNPEISQLGSCASIFLIYSLMMTVRPIATRRPAFPASSRWSDQRRAVAMSTGVAPPS